MRSTENEYNMLFEYMEMDSKIDPMISVALKF